MKTITLLTIMTLGITALAKDSQRVILKDSKTFTTEVSNETVRCTDLGYGNVQLKINLAGLDGWTLFDHTNSHVGEFGDPCMTAGRCQTQFHQGGFTLNDLIQNNPGSETVTVQREVIESKVETKNADNVEICQRSLIENLSTKVRGIAFKHTRQGAHQEFPIEACRK